MNPVQMLLPVFAMFGLVAFVLTRLALVRLRAVRAGEVPLDFYRDYRGDAQSETLVVVSRHFQNLFEVPVLFYALCLMACATSEVNALLVGLAWLFVAARYAHSYVHLTSNRVLLRFPIYAASFATLVLMALVLLVGLLGA